MVASSDHPQIPWWSTWVDWPARKILFCAPKARTDIDCVKSNVTFLQLAGEWPDERASRGDSGEATGLLAACGV